MINLNKMMTRLLPYAEEIKELLDGEGTKTIEALEQQRREIEELKQKNEAARIKLLDS